MKSNKIEGVKPFNEFFFRNCFWHQLIAGVACLGIEAKEVLINYVAFPKNNFELDESGILSTKQFERFFGYRCKPCGLSERSLKRRIDKGCPVIVGVDCFFLESRADTYQKLHDPHFVLCYGYDIQKRQAFVVDHNYRNGFDFTEKVVSLDNILLSNRMYKKYIRRTRLTSRVLYSTKRSETGNVLKTIGWNRLKEWQQNSKENLHNLRCMISGNIDELEKKSERIIVYLEKMKMTWLSLSKAELFSEIENNEIIISKLRNGYAVILLLFWKMRAHNDFAYVNKCKDNIFRKLDEIESSEEIVYNLLSEAGDEKISNGRPF